MLGDSRAKAQGPDAAGAQGSQTKPKIKLPPGYANESAFLSEMRQLFYDDVQYDRLNREAALEDLRFVVGDQWDDIVRQRREAGRKPVLTVNRLPAFIAQVVGNRRLNETDIKVLPDNGGTVDIATVREGLIRNVQKQSRADQAYDKALEGAAMCGLGNFRLELDYDNDDVFEQSMRIRPINDHLAVVWDRTLTEPTGSDAGHNFIIETMPKKEYQAKWPWATAADVVTDVTLRGDLRMNGWIAIDDVRIVSYWRMRTHKRTLALMTDGNTRDITDQLADETTAADTLKNVVSRDDGTPIMREVDKKFAQMYLCSGLDILAGPYNLPISRLPTFRVPGWEVNVGEWKHRWGLVRFLKDPQRMHNYSRSIWVEKMMQTPRSVWLAGKKAVQGRENDFRQSHLSDNALLIWDDEAANKPERIPPAQFEQAWAEMSELTAQDIKDVSNIHEANLGMPSNEVSGAAIVARQRVSDTGTVIYNDNLAQAIEQCGMVMNELIPIVYDTPRIVKILGDDAKQNMVAINQTGNDASDITVGKYSVTVSTGPSYQTKRIEAAQNMQNLANAMPEVLQVAADQIVEAQDWPGAQKIAQRIRRTMPPELLDPSDITPDMAQNIANKAQQQKQQLALMVQQAIDEHMKNQSETALNSARARNFESSANATDAKIPMDQQNLDSQVADRTLRGSLEAIKTAHEGA